MKPCVPRKLPLESLDWESFVPLLSEANRGLAKYDGLLHGVTNPDVLLSPITTQEAVLSSKIEGTQADLEDVLKYEAGADVQDEPLRADIHEIINYRVAMLRAVRELEKRPISLNLIKRIHSILLDSVRGRDKGRGEFRRFQNWIGTPGSPIEDARFIPPDPLYLMEHLDNWEKYIHSEEKDALVQLAIIHAQFEIIHPFMDGNGRVGRMLIPLFLYDKRILSRPVFYLSAYLERNRDRYISCLRAIEEENGWNRWIRFFLAAVAKQAEENTIKAQKVLKCYESLKSKTLDLTHSQYAVPLLDAMFDRPIFRGKDLYESEGAPSKQRVMAMLSDLERAGIITTLSVARGRKPKIMALPELLNICEGREVLSDAPQPGSEG